jgi:type VI secretion system protein ImpK
MDQRGESFLFDRFHEFYSEVIGLKQMILSGTWAFTSDAPPEGHGSFYDKIISGFWEKLATLLESRQVTAMQMGTEYWTPLYREAQYIMVALADEIFIHMDWEGREVWKSNLLESRFFKTHIAGELFFERIDQLLQNRDPAHTGIAKIYLLALALGFQGKYRGNHDESRLYDYRRRLFYFIARRDPGILTQTAQLFPEAYAYTLEGGRERRLPDTRKWIFLLMGVIALFLVSGHLIWIDVTSDISEIIRKILME